ncbi:lysophospholipid acyltransferase family protein [Marinoscillum furvescens]|uniref:1-acyl-sn-glycerol-3-phosphate acyltransferase n=1 Tax=Marinoscillum furvescens DSM 4134 TaxID=1122208 RepID=A0A3D9LHS7_MARFU|nr:lysophospholipid acyltransferase family protein [Marinoscillum furvescens]REE05971.1 1-acyl-sn-glycerol-3-phosphate acyltransferase [Marinoscillum furvescens DSM 4134]
MKIAKSPYTWYAILVFLMSCVIVVPTLALLSTNRRWHLAGLQLHRWWAKIVFWIWRMPVEISGLEHLKTADQKIYCSNHFSYLDIPTFFLTTSGKLIGKSSLTNIPLFGYFFKKMHIPVNRSSMRSRAESMKRSQQAIDEGYDVAFFPEGGIRVQPSDLPYMCSFKDGAFRLAVENQLPIIPITKATNFIILPDVSEIKFRHTPCKITVHPPIYPQGKGETAIKALKEQVFNTIQSELLKHHPDKVKTVS